MGGEVTRTSVNFKNEIELKLNIMTTIMSVILIIMNYKKYKDNKKNKNDNINEGEDSAVSLYTS